MTNDEVINVFLAEMLAGAKEMYALGDLECANGLLDKFDHCCESGRVPYGWMRLAKACGQLEG